ncbi:MAG: CRISPR-associated endoribonuclease Cas6 [Bacteroidota bacterium]|nr:CRISPR-associated endoribonuclease Cas6 [Bacteroidota bacterium]
MAYRMRLRIELRARATGVVGWDYRYALAAWVYGLLRRIEPAYAEFLHQHGYALDARRRTRLFTFSFRVPTAQPTPEGLAIRPGTRAEMLLSSPLQEAFLKPVVEAIIAYSRLELVVPPHRAVWQVEAVEAMPPPLLGEAVTAQLLSPVVVSVPGAVHPQYLYALDERVPEQLRQNALKKYRALTGCDAPGDIRFAVDRTYVEQKGGEHSRRITSLHRIKAGTPEETAIRAFRAPIHIQGDRRIIAVLYDCGIGEKNSMGFGCWQPLPAKRIGSPPDSD